MNAEIIQERLGRRFALPSMPRVCDQLQAALEDPEIGVNDLAQIIALDPPLAARLLRAVNAAWTDLSRPVVALPHAASVVGMRGLRNLFTRAPVHPVVLAAGSSGAGLRELWRISILAGRLCRSFAGSLPGLEAVDGEEMYSHGLLHDIGAIAMYEALGAEWEAVYRESMGERRDLADLEQQAFGFSHTGLGAMLAARWSMPETVIAAIRFHHNEGRAAELDPLSAAVHLANALATAVVAEDQARLEKRIQPKSLRKLEVDPEALSDLLERAYSLAPFLPA